jgi:hypothetical protein
VSVQGYVNGLHYDRNAAAPVDTSATDLMRAADLVRVGLAGSLRDFRLPTFEGRELPLAQIPYGGGQPAGYVTSPGEVVNYVENHDNQTLYDLNAFKLPLGTSTAERARVQILAVALNAYSQGITYFHAGMELLRSKSMDRNSFDSGDWLNRIDWTGQDNFFGTGLPPARVNEPSWPLMRPHLADPRLHPSPADIAWSRGAFTDLPRIRSSSTLFRLHSTAAVAERLSFLNTGPQQVPEVIVGHLAGPWLPGSELQRDALSRQRRYRNPQAAVRRRARQALRAAPGTPRVRCDRPTRGGACELRRSERKLHRSGADRGRVRGGVTAGHRWITQGLETERCATGRLSIDGLPMIVKLAHIFGSFG